jgi:Domain of unknown function (DUF4282)/zinc-ribbon domain
MQTKGFLASLFDFSFQSFITAKLIKVLYALMTIGNVLFALFFIVSGFNQSTEVGIVTLILSPLFFLLAMIYARVLLELIIVFFRIHEDVREINVRGGGGTVAAAAVVPPLPPLGPPPPATVAPAEPRPVATATPSREPASSPPEAPASLFCTQCGATLAPGARFCTTCGHMTDGA